MKKVLVTGASGNIGIKVIKYLLSEGKYEITALDLKNKKTAKNLKRYRKRINIIYADINDSVIIEALVKDHDYIIHLASVLPPLGDFSPRLSKLIEYDGTESIIKAINYYNKDCYLFYASTTSVYTTSIASTKDKIDKDKLTPYSLNKYETELLIKKKLKNYTIFRIPLVLNTIKHKPIIFNINKNNIVEVTTTRDVAYAFVKALDYKEKINRKIFNIGFGEKGRALYSEILKNILKEYGISMKYIFGRIFLSKNCNSPILSDSDLLDNILKYRQDSLSSYYNRLRNKSKKRYIQKFLAKPFIFFNNKS